MKNKKILPKSVIQLITFSLSCSALFFILGLPHPQFSQGNTVNTIPKADEARNKHVQQVYDNLPLSFIQNDGQVDKKVKFYEKGSGRTTFFAEDGVHLS